MVVQKLHLVIKRKTVKTIQRNGWDNYPVCMAKTQYSFSDDQTALGRHQTLKLRFEN